MLPDFFVPSSYPSTRQNTHWHTRKKLIETVPKRYKTMTFVTSTTYSSSDPESNLSMASFALTNQSLTSEWLKKRSESLSGSHRGCNMIGQQYHPHSLTGIKKKQIQFHNKNHICFQSVTYLFIAAYFYVDIQFLTTGRWRDHY